MRSQVRRAIRSVCVLSCLGLISYGVVGCGGSSSTPTPSPSSSPTTNPSPSPSPVANPTRARVTIAWDARTRVEGLSSALSARIVFTGAQPDGKDLIFTAERPGTTGAPTLEYISAENGVVGKPVPLTITFYADVNQTGDVVGTAQANATIKPDGTIDSTIATYGRIQSVRVDPGQSVLQGQSTSLRYAGLAADGTTQIMIRPGAARFSIASGADKVAIEGDFIRGIKPREALLVVSIDQASSAPTSFLVLSDAKITPNVSSLTLSIEKTFAFSATVTGSNITDTGVVWGLSGAPSDVSISPTGVLTVGRTETIDKTPDNFSVTVSSLFDPDPAKTVTIPVKVASKVLVTIANKQGAIVGIGDKLRLSAISSDPDGPLPDTGVTWQVVDKVTGKPITGAGTIDSSGVYTAPNTVGSYRVVATSTYDTRKSDFVDVNVIAGSIGVDVQ